MKQLILLIELVLAFTLIYLLIDATIETETTYVEVPPE